MIDLSDNHFQGEIPRSLVNCTSLEFLDLGNNGIMDTFPFWLGALPELKVLILQSNRLYGAISEPDTYCGFPKLRIIDLSNNKFTGKLPSKYFQCWNSMKVVKTSQLKYMQDGFFGYAADTLQRIIVYDYSLKIVNKGKMMAYTKISTILTAIILSSNRFDGEIPTSIANLRGLQNLNLSNNNLQGHIPSCLSNLTNLESLDLSRNELSGQIPQQLVELTFLGSFSVSDNHLRGPIPQGNQFTTFENTSFDGNSGLCGKPLSKKCGNYPKTTESEDTIQDSESLFLFDWKIILIGYGGGLVVGVILGLNFSTKIQGWFAGKFGRQSKRMRRKGRRRN
ncbi:putative Leucine-rich receptor-like kinase family protein [Melia azedarach]|uniref:Leucine-rich receptor-like kinase family protein n=1 Tax=Melia azedarach TaxID=155640 RepID=A0ACC1Y2F8_MELAZ|nr:putative Leucine-rich receptor-like kinase family protein [Melia azedarach]